MEILVVDLVRRGNLVWSARYFCACKPGQYGSVIAKQER